MAAVAGGITVVPGGKVEIGWYCETEFRATLLGAQNLWCTWYIESGSVTQYLGTTGGGVVWFLLNGASYFLYPVNMNDPSSSFRIRCDYGAMPLLEAYSDYVVLNYEPYQNSPCVSLKQASFVGEDSPCRIKGDDHDARPRLRVEIDHPAGPSGQLVSLIMDDPHSPTVGRWLGRNYLVIPYGQTSVEADGIVGTRKVTSTKTMSIRARVNGRESAPLTMEVTRK
jgi:hypothetical protein